MGPAARLRRHRRIGGRRSALLRAGPLSQQFFHGAPPHSAACRALVCLIAGFIAYRDVKLSAEVMLWIEVVSLSLILIVLAVLVFRFGLQFDLDQFRLKGATISSLGPALVLAMFSFVGFESATTLGSEARDPLRTIPRAVIQCAILAGVFFMLCAYSEVLGFRGESSSLSDTTSPLHLLAAKAGISPLGVAIDFGAAISMFACVLACTTAAARVLLRMAHGKVSPQLARTHQQAPRHTRRSRRALRRPHVRRHRRLSLRGVPGSDMYDLVGLALGLRLSHRLALVAAALPFARRALGQHSLRVAPSASSPSLVMILIVIFDLHSATDAIHARIPWIYLAYIAAGVAWYALRRKKAIA